MVSVKYGHLILWKKKSSVGVVQTVCLQFRIEKLDFWDWQLMDFPSLILYHFILIEHISMWDRFIFAFQYVAHLRYCLMLWIFQAHMCISSYYILQTGTVWHDTLHFSSPAHHGCDDAVMKSYTYVHTICEELLLFALQGVTSQNVSEVG